MTPMSIRKSMISFPSYFYSELCMGNTDGPLSSGEPPGPVISGHYNQVVPSGVEVLRVGSLLKLG